MTPEAIVRLLESVRDGRSSIDDALSALASLPFADIGFAKVDGHRELRTGIPEVIFAPGKSPQQIVEIAQGMRGNGQSVLVTRINEDQSEAIAARFDAGQLHCAGSTIRIGPALVRTGERRKVAVVSAGTSDQGVAAEVEATLQFLGISVDRHRDVGVAGIHRLLAKITEIQGASVAIVVAGMEGALPSVVGGLVDLPVIAVPTSVGYGASFEGLAALLSMLNSCAAGVTVVNIDNGFGAAVAAYQILRSARIER
jgi:hypothetical protein